MTYHTVPKTPMYPEDTGKAWGGGGEQGPRQGQQNEPGACVEAWPGHSPQRPEQCACSCLRPTRCYHISMPLARKHRGPPWLR